MSRHIKTLRKSGKSVVAVCRLVRIWNVLMIVMAVYLGGYLALGSAVWVDPWSVTLAALAAGMLASAANIMNDLVDVSSDKINHPDRPLVTGHLSEKHARWLGVFLFVVSIGAVAPLTTAHHLLFGASVIVLALYNVWGSRLPLVGNLFVVFAVAVSIPFGAIEHGLRSTVWIAAIFAGLTTLVREINKDIEDIEGDSSVGVHSLPLLLGEEKSRWVVRILSLLTVVSSVVPFLFFNFGGLYLMMVSVTNLFLLLPMSRKTDVRTEARTASTSLKWAMMWGMMALAVSETNVFILTP